MRSAFSKFAARLRKQPPPRTWVLYGIGFTVGHLAFSSKSEMGVALAAVLRTSAAGVSPQTCEASVAVL